MLLHLLIYAWMHAELKVLYDYSDYCTFGNLCRGCSSFFLYFLLHIIPLLLLLLAHT